MALNSDVAVLIEEARDRPAIALDGPASAMREAWRAESARMRGEPDPSLAGVVIRDDVIDDVPVRWYGSELTAKDDIIVYLHGGGWMLGDVDAYDIDVRLLASRLGRAVVAVEYRRTPETSFPAPLDDCVRVIERLAAMPHRRLAIAGDSAGANLALGSALVLASRQAIDAVLALYPVIDPHATENDSYRANGEGYLLTTEAMRLYWRSYTTTPAHAADPRANLRLASLEGFPPTVLVTAEYDPLRDEAKDFAARLIAADVPTTYLPNCGLTHGFQQMVPRIPTARQALLRAYDAFADALSASSVDGEVLSDR